MNDKKDVNAKEPTIAAKETPPVKVAPKTDGAENASDEQLEKVAGGQRYYDDRGGYRDGEYGGHHYHDGYRGRWDGGIWIQL